MLLVTLFLKLRVCCLAGPAEDREDLRVVGGMVDGGVRAG